MHTTLRLLSSSSVLPRLVRWISGTFISSSSLRYAFSVNSRQHVPGPVRPARPLRWFAAARLSGYTCADMRAIICVATSAWHLALAPVPG